MPLREGIRNHAVGHPATLGPQGLHAPSEYPKLYSRTAAMTTSGCSNQMVNSTLGVNNTQNGWVEMDGTVGLHDTVTIGGKLNRTSSVQPRVVIWRDCRFQTLPRSTRILRVLHSSSRLLPPDADTLHLTRCDDHVAGER